MVSASITSPEMHLFANRPSGKGRWVPRGLVRERWLGANTHMSPRQYIDNAGGEIDLSLSDTLRPLLSPSFSHESSNELVISQPECVQREQKTMLNYERDTCSCFGFDVKTCG